MATGADNPVERLIGRCKQFRRPATRYEKLAENHRAMWVIAAILLRLYRLVPPRCQDGHRGTHCAYGHCCHHGSFEVASMLLLS